MLCFASTELQLNIIPAGVVVVVCVCVLTLTELWGLLYVYTPALWGPSTLWGPFLGPHNYIVSKR